MFFEYFLRYVHVKLFIFDTLSVYIFHSLNIGRRHHKLYHGLCLLIFDISFCPKHISDVYLDTFDKSR